MAKSKKTKKDLKLIVANWKMAPNSIKEAKKILTTLNKTKIQNKKTSVVLCPPTIYAQEIIKNYRGKKFKFGLQNVSHTNDEAQTGEVSTKMAKSIGAEYVVLGHAERRALGEDSFLIAKKLNHVIAEGLKPLLCVGEIVRDSDGEYLKFLEQQIIESLTNFKKNNLSKLTLVYEPVWAMGSGHKAMNTHEIQQMTIFLKKILVSLYGRGQSLEVPILYGGSVDDDNAPEIIIEGGVDGLLIGRASLNPHTFANIIKNINSKV